MKKPKNKKLILVCIFSFVLLGTLLSASAYAAPIKLNVNYPCIPAPGGCIDLDCIETGACAPTIANIIITIFVAAIWVGGLVAFISLVYTGIQFIVGGESPSVRAAARERLKNVVWGIVILLLTYLVLNFINPQIVDLQDPGTKGVGCGQWNWTQCSTRSECLWTGDCRGTPGSGCEQWTYSAKCSSFSACKWYSYCTEKPLPTEAPGACTKLNQTDCNKRSDCSWDGSKCVQEDVF